jgi:putative PIN family toxin of toxin-antitoxin system
MIRVFVDANVLFAASYSSHGSSRDLILAAIEDKVQIVVSKYVLTEAERNLARKAPRAIPAFTELTELLSVEVVDKPNLEDVLQAAEYTALKDAPVVAAALSAQVDYMVTWDRKHLIEDIRVADRSGLKIVTPDRIIELIGP